MALQIFARRTAEPKQNGKRCDYSAAVGRYEPSEPARIDSDPLNRCFQLERYGYLLTNRHKWQRHPKLSDICRQVIERLDERFAMVPEGFSSLPQTIGDVPGAPDVTVGTEAFLLSRHAVTNAQFQAFIDDHAYEQLDLWPQDIWPHLIDFKDLTGHAAPRFWRHGRHSKPLANHPVVGICVYEAEAYTKWAGYRLPTEAEWQMAATWRIQSAAITLRRYPWGDALDIQRCNVWSSGIGHTVPVDHYPGGAAPNHVLQLIGNVWEWTSGSFDTMDDRGGAVVGDMQMSPIRGGAFDTYFAAQATGAFRTGLASLARCQNVGFRCARDIRHAKEG